MSLQRAFLTVVIGLALVSCEQEKSAVPVDAVVDQYLNLPTPPYKYASEQFGDLQIQLGRVLFYDPALSANNTISCASCHKQEYAFGDNVSLSKGFNGELTLRNTQPLVGIPQLSLARMEPNATRHPGGLFWDGRRASMTEAVMEPIFNHIEMGMDWHSLQEKLRELPYYAPLFEKAYLKPDITYTGVQQALAAFISVIKSDPAKNNRRSLTAEEKIGAGLFATKYECNACHLGSLDLQGNFQYHSSSFGFPPADAHFANIGLEESYKDNGLSLTTLDASDAGRFRVPDLSNVALTAPYMHDGSIASLEEVIDHYSGGIASHPYLDSKLKDTDNTPMRLNITEDEKKALVAFLKTFRDDDVALNAKLANPFKVN